MSVVLYLIPHLGVIGQEVGIIDDEVFEKIIKQGEYLKLKCVSYLDYVGDTILNQKQLRVLMDELELLKQHDRSLENEYNIFINACGIALQSPQLYLLINGE